MRAARSPGIAATRLARTSAPTATIAIEGAGTVGCGTAEMLCANRVHSHRPVTMPMGTPTTVPMIAATDACAGDGGDELAAGEAERLEQREVSASSSHGDGQSECQRDDRSRCEGDGEEGGRVAHRSVVHDLGRTLDRQQRDRPADRRHGLVRVGLIHDPL